MNETETRHDLPSSIKNEYQNWEYWLLYLLSSSNHHKMSVLFTFQTNYSIVLEAGAGTKLVHRDKMCFPIKLDKYSPVLKSAYVQGWSGKAVIEIGCLSSWPSSWNMVWGLNKTVAKMRQGQIWGCSEVGGTLEGMGTEQLVRGQIWLWDWGAIFSGPLLGGWGVNGREKAGDAKFVCLYISVLDPQSCLSVCSWVLWVLQRQQPSWLSDKYKRKAEMLLLSCMTAPKMEVSPPYNRGSKQQHSSGILRDIKFSDHSF